jgi:hypothetical protein
MTDKTSAAPPAVSVVIPVRNGAATLDRCLSALKQALRHALNGGEGSEVIIVDDGSTDATKEVASLHPVRVISPPPGATGAAAARNAGAAEAAGDVLVFLDADVIVEPPAIASLLERLDAEPAVDAAIGTYSPCDASLGPWSRAKDLAVRLNHARSGDEIPWFWTAIGAIRSSAFHAAGGFDEARFPKGAVVEDMDLGFRLSAGGGRIAQVSEARARHHHRFDLAGLVGNDFAKSRAWARMLRDGAADAAGHGATGSSEALALACALAALGGSAATPVAPGAASPVAAAGWLGLAWLLRDHLRQAASERGAAEAASYLAIRALLYPVAGAGAACGLLEGLWTARARSSS